MRFAAALLFTILLLSTSTLAQISHPAEDVLPGSFPATGNFRFLGTVYFGDLSAGILPASAAAPRLAITDQLGTPVLYLRDGNLGVGVSDPSTRFDVSGGVRFRSLASCSALGSDSIGNVLCGTGGGSGGSGGGPIVTGDYSDVTGSRSLNIEYTNGPKSRLVAISFDTAQGVERLSIYTGSSTANMEIVSGGGTQAADPDSIVAIIPANYKYKAANIGPITITKWVEKDLNDAGASLPGGSSGQTLRHDGSNWVGSSNIYNDGTNVGIGKTNPAGKLDVQGSLCISGDCRTSWTQVGGGFNSALNGKVFESPILAVPSGVLQYGRTGGLSTTGSYGAVPILIGRTDSIAGHLPSGTKIHFVFPVQYRVTNEQSSPAVIFSNGGGSEGTTFSVSSNGPAHPTRPYDVVVTSKRDSDGASETDTLADWSQNSIDLWEVIFTLKGDSSSLSHRVYDLEIKRNGVSILTKLNRRQHATAGDTIVREIAVGPYNHLLGPGQLRITLP